MDSKHVFRKNCNFVHSHDSPEVQVADILATIVSKYYNKKDFQLAYRQIKEFLSQKEKIQLEF